MHIFLGIPSGGLPGKKISALCHYFVPLLFFLDVKQKKCNLQMLMSAKLEINELDIKRKM
jgi:hypothetical protein